MVSGCSDTVLAEAFLLGAYRGKPAVFPKGNPLARPSERTQEATWRWVMDWMGWKPKAA
jgi:hypothetical protein